MVEGKESLREKCCVKLAPDCFHLCRSAKLHPPRRTQLRVGKTEKIFTGLTFQASPTLGTKRVALFPLILTLLIGTHFVRPRKDLQEQEEELTRLMSDSEKSPEPTTANARSPESSIGAPPLQLTVEGLADSALLMRAPSALEASGEREAAAASRARRPVESVDTVLGALLKDRPPSCEWRDESGGGRGRGSENRNDESIRSADDEALEPGPAGGYRLEEEVMGGSDGWTTGLELRLRSSISYVSSDSSS